MRNLPLNLSTRLSTRRARSTAEISFQTSFSPATPCSPCRILFLLLRNPDAGGTGLELGHPGHRVQGLLGQEVGARHSPREAMASKLVSRALMSRAMIFLSCVGRLRSSVLAAQRRQQGAGRRKDVARPTDRCRLSATGRPRGAGAVCRPWRRYRRSRARTARTRRLSSSLSGRPSFWKTDCTWRSTARELR